MNDTIELKAVIEMRYKRRLVDATPVRDVVAAENKQLQHLTQLVFGNDDDTEVISRIELVEEAEASER